VRAAGIDNFNLDLMYGLPGQDVAGALADLERALALEPTHLSHYQLTLEPDTPFAKRPPPAMPDDELAWAMQLACQERLAGAGFGHYEVSAYARPGWQCRHNVLYWQFGDYLGVGAGAHGKLSGWQGVVRTARVRHPAAFVSAPTRAARLAEARDVAATDLPFEFCLNALRLVAGFEVALFVERTGLQQSALQPGLQAAVGCGLLQQEGTRCLPTVRGRQYLNDLQALFLPV
jgi:oxygen-independent coproporphyrinogen-3 oxidase